MKIPGFNFDREIAPLCRRINELISVTERFGNRTITSDLWKTSRIRSIRSSLAIEGNELDDDEIKDIMQGKPVEGSFDDIIEAKNAVKTYELLLDVDIFSVDCFLKVESILMWALTEKEGYREGQVVISDGTTIYYIPPKAELVPELVERLFSWCSQSEYPLYILAAIAHYYIESIHPFPDGNGRMGRLWHTAMLQKQNPVFRAIPLEDAIFRRRQDYYDVLERCQKTDDSTEFVKFMLELNIEQLELLKTLYGPASSDCSPPWAIHR